MAFQKSFNNRRYDMDDNKAFDQFIISRRADICKRNGNLSSTEKNKLFSFQKLNTGIHFSEQNEIPIEVKGAQTPSVKSFNELSLNPQLAANISECGFQHMTPVQRASLPLSLEDKDMVTCAQTGSGKTAAFLIPMIQKILNNSSDSQKRPRGRFDCFEPSVLVLTPTRELAKQVYVQAVRLCHKTGVLPGLVYGGTRRYEQIRELKPSVDILIGTPGRVNDYINSQEVSLKEAFGLVLDEGDKMLDMGFVEQIQKIIDEGGFPVSVEQNPKRQVLLFSATFPSEIQQLASKYLAREKSVHITVGIIGASNKNIEQSFIETPSIHDKLNKLVELIQQCTRTDKWLVFVNTKRVADDLQQELRTEKNLRVAAIHGDKSQDARDNVLGKFKGGQVQILIATDVAARGLDIPDVSAVVNFDLAPSVDDHVHRIGRTARAGNTGKAYTFIGSNENKVLWDLVGELRKEKIEIPEFMESLSYAARGKTKQRGRGGYGGGRGGYGGGRGGYGGGRGGYGGGRGGYGAGRGGYGGVRGFNDHRDFTRGGR